MTDFPDVKLKALVSFPAGVVGGTGIDVTQQGGRYQFDLDFREITPVVAIPAATASTTYLLMWESTQNTFQRISITDLKTALASLP